MAHHTSSRGVHRRSGDRSAPSRRLVAVAAPLALAAVIAGCGGDDDADVEAAEPASFEIVAADYRFDGVPDTVATGSQFTLTNSSSAELHELIVIRIPDGEERPVSTLVGLPDHELEELFDDDELLATVIVAPPGEEGFAVVGDGTVTVPGRYALLCFIPTGVEPDEFVAAMEEAGGGPPQIDGGPPHVEHGMFAEVVVTG